VYGKGNTREGPSFDLDLPLSEKVVILGRCLGFEDKTWIDMKDCPAAKDLGTFDAERLKQIKLDFKFIPHSNTKKGKR